MAEQNRIRLIDFQDQGDQNGMDEDRLTFDYDQNDTIFNLKQQLADREGYDDPGKLKLFLHCLELEDHCLIKDCAEEAEGELNVLFPQYATIKCEGGDTFVFWKPTFGRRKWLKLFPGSSEIFKIPRNGKFAVMRNK